MRRYCLLFAVLAFISVWGRDQLTNIPTIYIDTENSQGIYDTENYVPCQVTIVTDVAEDAITDKTAGIRGRGNSTWGMAKKPYRIKFDKKINLFNRPAKAKSWTLLANYADKTLMRNAVAFEISRFVGFDFSPTAIFADVVLNGTYLGNYMVSDQMEVNKGRVDIDEMDATCTEGESLTGGYFLEIDGFGGAEPVHFTTNKGLIITVKSPDDDVIQPVQLNYIKTFVQTFETALFSANFADPETGFRKYVDVRTLVDWYICCELTGNSDAFWSTYIYKKRSDDHLYFGPLWDFDIAFNNDNRLGDAVGKLMRDNAHDWRTWIQRMWQAEWFRTAVGQRWRQLRSMGIEGYILDFIDATARYLEQSQALNFDKWRNLGTRVYREQFLFSTYQGGVDYLKSYITNRSRFLDLSFGSSDTASGIESLADGNEYYLIHYVGLVCSSEPANFYIEYPVNERQCLTFVAAGPGVWNIRTADGRLLASQDGDKYCTYMTDGTDNHARFTVEASRYQGYALIRNAATGLCLGIEHTAHMSRVSTNKDGSSTNHAWKIIPIGNTNSIGDVEMPGHAVRYDRDSDALICDDAAECRVYTLQGQCVLQGRGAVSTATLPSGLYIARTGSSTLKFLK